MDLSPGSRVLSNRGAIILDLFLNMDEYPSARKKNAMANTICMEAMTDAAHMNAFC